MFTAAGPGHPKREQDSARPLKRQELGSHGAQPQRTPTRTAPSGKADMERQRPGTKSPPGLWVTQMGELERDRMEMGRGQRNEEGLIGTCAFSLQQQRGEPQGHRAMEQSLCPRTAPRALCAGPRAAAGGQRQPCPGQAPAEGGGLTGWPTESH